MHSKFISIILVVSLLFSGCGAQDKTSVTMPLMPPWVVVNQPTISRVQLVIEIQKLYPGANLYFSDNNFCVVDYDWLQQYLKWEWKAARILNINYTENSFDCDKFALGFYFFATLAASKANMKASPMIERIVVQQTNTVMYVEGSKTGLHELISVHTNKGIFIVEPQPSVGAFRITPVKEYPNKILSVIVGDYQP